MFFENAITFIFPEKQVIFLTAIDFQKCCVIVDSQFEIMILKGTSKYDEQRKESSRNTPAGL